MNEQAKPNSMSHQSKTFKLDENVQDMIARVMTVARLLTTDSAAQDGLSAGQTHEGRKKHKNENL